MHSLIVLVSILAAVAGFFFLSEATMGVGIIGLAGVLGIWARMAQANKHHSELMKELGTREE